MSAVGLSTFVSYGTNAVLGSTKTSAASDPSYFQKLKNAIGFLGSSSNATEKKRQFSPNPISALAFQAPALSNRFLGVVQEFFKAAAKFFPEDGFKTLKGTGLLRGMSLVKSPLGIRSGIGKVKAAMERADKLGVFDASLQVTSRTTSFATTLVSLPIQALGLLEVFQRSEPFQRTAKVIGTVTGALFTFVSGLSLFSSSLSLHFKRKLYGDLRAIVKDPFLPEEERYQKAFDYLKGHASISKKEMDEICRQVYNDERVAVLSGERINVVTEKVAGIFLANKVGDLSKAVSPKSVRRIQRGELENAKTIVDAVYRDSKRLTVIQAISTTVSTVSLGAGIIAMILFTPEVALALTVISVVSSLVLLGLDIHNMFVQFGEASERKYDKLWIFATTVLAMVVLIIATALAEGILPIVATVGLGILWIAIAIMSYWRLHQLSQKQS